MWNFFSNAFNAASRALFGQENGNVNNNQQRQPEHNINPIYNDVRDTIIDVPHTPDKTIRMITRVLDIDSTQIGHVIDWIEQNGRKESPVRYNQLYLRPTDFNKIEINLSNYLNKNAISISLLNEIIALPEQPTDDTQMGRILSFFVNICYCANQNELDSLVEPSDKEEHQIQDTPSTSTTSDNSADLEETDTAAPWMVNDKSFITRKRLAYFDNKKPDSSSSNEEQPKEKKQKLIL